MTITDDVVDQERPHGGALWIPPASVYPFTVPVNTSATLIGGAALLMGHATEETAGAAGRLVITDGANGVIGNNAIPLTYNALQSRLDQFSDKGLIFLQGITVSSTLSTVGGALFIVPMTRELLRKVIAHRHGLGG